MSAPRPVNKWPPKPGEVLVVGNDAYTTCSDCGKVVRINKWLVGCLHLCVPPEERSR